MDNKRIRVLKKGKKVSGPVIYWMSRDQRVSDNWALLYAQEFAIKQNTPLGVVFCLVPTFLNATLRQYSFMLKGLREVEEKLAEKNIPFFMLYGEPANNIPKFIEDNGISILITDFNPLLITRKWKDSVANKVNIPFFEIDAHNIIPCWIASSKQEYAAYTIRPKIHRLLPDFLQEFPVLKKHTYPWKGKTPQIEWVNVQKKLSIDRKVPEVKTIIPGERAAIKILHDFLKNKLHRYYLDRNDPTKSAQSELSPYLHFGQISAQRVVLEVMRVSTSEQTRKAFLEEIIVRRELSDNFCFFNNNYNNFNGFPEWAKKTLNKHRNDPRKYVYTLEQFENFQTHDALWNASQLEMVKRGKMHGYLRMYWAKKILEWSESPETALKIAIYLNDKYELDGRDPNGYTGIAWSIGGVHDRAWNERKIFGKIRYMSYNGCKSKFNIIKYIEYVNSL
ncbi:MAG: deoxyribodipyrimidine photo-lyase [Nitrospirae bacterium]|nr:deoxyribodipyrimidine photo-lyase [Nitrospirota bacterium]